MKKLFAAIVSIIMMFGLIVLPAQAATMDEIQTSIASGLAWLVPQQNPDGSWGTSEYVATTAFVVTKLEERSFELGYSGPFDTGYPYKNNVENGLDYIFANAVAYAPDKIIFSPAGHTSYNTGIAMMAIAGSAAPDRIVTAPGAVTGWTYRAVVQACVDFFTATQRADGGWRYYGNDNPSDNSNTGFVVLGLRCAEEFGCTIPAALKTNLSSFIDLIQDDVDGDEYDGGSWYVPPGSSGWPDGWRWANMLKTGNLLFEMAFVGDTLTAPRVQDAIDYIERHWHDAWDEAVYPEWSNPTDPNYLTTYCLMKGFVAVGADTISVGGSDVDWFNSFADILITTQNPDGSWSGGWWLDSIQSTVLNLLTLEKIAPPPVSSDYAITASPETDVNPVGTQHSVTATVWLDDSDPETADTPAPEGVTVGFKVISGPNAGNFGSGATDAGGQVVFSYSGNSVAGTDTVRAWVDSDNDGDWTEGEAYVDVTRDWVVNFVTGGGNIKSGKKVAWTFAGTVGFIDDGTSNIFGQYQITDHVNNVSWHCRNNFDSLVFSGGSTWSPPAGYDVCTFEAYFTSHKGGEMYLQIVVTDSAESGKKGDSIVVKYRDGDSFELLFAGDPISSGNLQVHDGHK